jgi:hypothetical protein
MWWSALSAGEQRAKKETPMWTVAIRIDAPATGIEITGEGTSPTDEQMAQETAARNAFLDRLSPVLAALPQRPLRRFGNVSQVQLLGGGTWSKMNHYLVLLSVDTAATTLDLAAALPPGTEYSVIGSYEPIEHWPIPTSSSSQNESQSQSQLA